MDFPEPWRGRIDHSARPLVIGIPDSRRIAAFQEALAEAALPPARVMSWLELLEGYSPAMFIEPGAIFRVESPAGHFATWQALTARGRGPLSRREVFSAEEDPGRIRFGAQWHSGLCEAMRQLGEQLQAAEPHARMSDPEAIALLHHRDRCQGALAAAGVPVPPALPSPSSWEALRDQLREHPRVFLKSLHGRSTGAILAVERGPRGRHRGWSAAALRGDRLYRDRGVRALHRERELAQLAQAICAAGARLERWIPRANLGGEGVDLRVLCIAGEPRHAALRTSRSPLGGPDGWRGGADRLRRAMGGRAWAATLAACRRAAAALPGSLYVALDLLLTPDWQVMVLGADPFGDHLPGLRHRGEEPHLAELVALGA